MFQINSKTNIDNIIKDRKGYIRNNKLILKIQQRCKSEKHNVYTEEINKIALNSDDCKKIKQLI